MTDAKVEDESLGEADEQDFSEARRNISLPTSSSKQQVEL